MRSKVLVVLRRGVMAKIMSCGFSFERCLIERLAGALAGILLLNSASAANNANTRQPSPAKIDFNRDIRPIFSDICSACHGPDDNKRKAGLRLDLKESAF